MGGLLFLAPILVLGEPFETFRNFEVREGQGPDWLGFQACPGFESWDKSGGEGKESNDPTWLLSNAQHFDIMVGHDLCLGTDLQRCDFRHAHFYAELLEGTKFECGSKYELKTATNGQIRFGVVAGTFERQDVQFTYVYIGQQDADFKGLLPDIPELPNLVSCPVDDFDKAWEGGMGAFPLGNAVITPEGTLMMPAWQCTYICADSGNKCVQGDLPLRCSDGAIATKIKEGDERGCGARFASVTNGRTYEFVGLAYDSVLGVAAPAAPGEGPSTPEPTPPGDFEGDGDIPEEEGYPGNTGSTPSPSETTDSAERFMVALSAAFLAVA